MLARARAASRVVGSSETSIKNGALRAMAQAIDAAHSDLLEANARDVEAGSIAGLDAALLDRLELNAERIGAIA